MQWDFPWQPKRQTSPQTICGKRSGTTHRVGRRWQPEGLDGSKPGQDDFHEGAEKGREDNHGDGVGNEAFHDDPRLITALLPIARGRVVDGLVSPTIPGPGRHGRRR